MSIIKKIKDFFFESSPEIPEVVEPEIVSVPKGEILTTCTLCNNPIGSEDKFKEFNDAIVHKRCFKKALKLSTRGYSPEQIARMIK